MPAATRSKTPNAAISDTLYQLAELLEVEGDDRFRVRAYRSAARMVAEHPASFAEMVERGDDLVPLPTIGHDIARKVEEIVRTGKLADLERLEARTDPVRLRLLKVEGVGTQRLAEIESLLGTLTPERIRAAAESGELARLRSVGPTVQAAILKAFRA